MDKIDTKNCLKEQIEKINDFKKKINEKIEEIKKKELEEKIKKEKEDAKKKVIEQKQEKEIQMRKVQNFNNKNRSIDSKNIRYVDKRLGVQLEIPASWEGHYEAGNDEIGKSLSIVFVTSNGERGMVFYMEQYDGNENIAKIPYYKNMYENIHYKVIGGVKYIVGIPNFPGVSPNNPQYNLYLNARNQARSIEDTIRPIK